MADELKIEYRLFALEPTRENVEIAVKERFSRVTPFYVLLYRSGQGPKGSVEIKGDDTKRLSDEDNRWVLDCNVIILSEEIEKRRPDIVKQMSERVEALEEELKRRRDELAQKGEG